MARMTYRARKKLKSTSYAIPKGTPARKEKTSAKGSVQPKGSYPIQNIAHARAALAMVAGARSGKPASPAIQAAVKRKVYAKFPGLKKRAAARKGK